MARNTLVSTTKEIKELTAGDVSLVIAWLVAAPARNAPEKPIRIFRLNNRYSFNRLLLNQNTIIQRNALNMSRLRTVNNTSVLITIVSFAGSSIALGCIYLRMHMV